MWVKCVSFGDLLRGRFVVGFGNFLRGFVVGLECKLWFFFKGFLGFNFGDSLFFNDGKLVIGK